MKIAFLFPGQGSQAVGMGRAFAEESPAATAVWRKADEALGFSLSRLCFEGPEADLALTSGVHTALDVLKAMMAGASVAMMTSELLEHGIGRLTAILADLQEWMVEHEYDSIALMKGSMSQRAVAEPAAFERANYMKILDSYRPVN